MKNSLLITVVLVISYCSSVSSAHSQAPLSEVSLFFRCYGQLAERHPKVSDPLLADVKAGRKTALQACTEVLDRAKLTGAGGTTIQDTTDPLAKAVLSSFHQLHRSWSQTSGLVLLDSYTVTEGAKPWYEDRPMGSYVTRALFSPGFNVDSIISGSDFLQPVRTNMNPPKTWAGVPNAGSVWRLGDRHPFAPVGDLLGVRAVSLPPVTFPVTRFSTSMGFPDFANIGVPPDAVQDVGNTNFANTSQLKGPLQVTEAFAVRIRGTLLVPTDGDYSFSAYVGGYVQVLIDGERAINGFTSLRVFHLFKGPHSIEVQYALPKGDGILYTNWKLPGTNDFVPIPPSAESGLKAEYYTQYQDPSVQLTGSEGGGFIGSHNYLLTVYNHSQPDYVPDGQVKTDRTYARAVLNDALCREAPVVRESDVEQWVVPKSSTPFRREAACTQCHATYDQIAGGALRLLRWNPLGFYQVTPAGWGINGVRVIQPTLGEVASWPATLDPDYAVRAPSGRFYFRNYRGELVDEPIHSIAELGAVILKQDDFYACLAKRYYRYLLGIEVNLGDPGDPSYQAPNSSAAFHRQQVIDLGLKLKDHKSLRQLILDIMNTAQYRMTDFGASYGGPT